MSNSNTVDPTPYGKENMKHSPRLILAPVQFQHRDHLAQSNMRENGRVNN